MDSQSISTTNPLSPTSKVAGGNWWRLVISVVAFTGAFALPHWNLALYGFDNDLYSHCWLMPLVCAYLIWSDKAALTGQKEGNPIRVFAIIPAALAVLLLILYQANRSTWVGNLYENALSSLALAYVLAIYAAAFFFLNASTLKTIAFPLAIALFTAPFPIPVKDAIVTFFQHTSAEAAYWMLNIAGNTIYREGLVFHLPSISIEVAPQCSGIRSSLVLFIVSLVASHLFLKTAWKKIAIVLFVIPLAIGRNGLRIFTLGELCERISPDMIDSWIHHRGGPIFFAISLIPFFVFLFFSWKSEPKEAKPLTQS